MIRIQRIRVPLGFVYGLAFLYWAKPTPSFLWAGMSLAAIGLGIRVWSSGYLEKGKVLAQSGPYSFTRNPLYFGSFVMGLGLTLSGGNPWLMVLFPPLFLAIYIPVMRREEGELMGAFGESYRSYKKRVPLFLPAVRYGNGGKAGGNFRWEKVISNREYKAVVGFVLVAVVLWGKMIWL